MGKSKAILGFVFYVKNIKTMKQVFSDSVFKSQGWLTALVTLALLVGFNNHAYASDLADVANANLSEIDSLSTGTTGQMAELIEPLEEFLKDFAKLMAGPVAMGGLVCAIVITFGSWILAPKNSILGPSIRVILASIVLTNSTGIINGVSGLF